MLPDVVVKIETENQRVASAAPLRFKLKTAERALFQKNNNQKGQTPKDTYCSMSLASILFFVNYYVI